MAGALRAALLGLLVLGAAGAAADLLLIGHVEGASQMVPLVLLALAMASALASLAAPSAATVRLLRLVMASMMAGGLLGLWFHYRANIEFAQELSPASQGLVLFWEAIKGASPPSLAPATLVHLGLLGLAATYRHPQLHPFRSSRSSQSGEPS